MTSFASYSLTIYQYKWNGFVSSFHPENLFSELLGRLEAVILRDRKDTKEPLAAAEVVVADGSVVFLTGCVENIDLYLFTVQDNLKKANRELIFCNKLRIIEQGSY